MMKLPFVTIKVNRTHNIPFLEVFRLTELMNLRLKEAIPDVETVVSITGMDDLLIEGRPNNEVLIIAQIYRGVWGPALSPRLAQPD
ncbi:hypothetical protein J1782_01790 [Rahnella sp. BCC 1045]|uniref:hypothetical protein n=1 Tax=Rahnella sp. BCC 1045 TaxID=2816251 RepID=UPI001C269787|nr:hypothetical protein [Rahnella sp. BCC 1045]MBU9818621.1 hypothetical protein [Rahnella sp. BCC 1045]